MVICVFLCVQESNWQEESALNVSNAKKKISLAKNIAREIVQQWIV